jgi:predicted phosphodiesterase
MPHPNGNYLIAKDYRTKFPDMPTKKLARIMYADNNISFKSEETARSSLRYIEGKNGVLNRNRSTIKNSEFLKEEARPYNPYNLPSSDETVFEPYEIKGHKRVLVLSDIHAPYHNIESITLALQHAKKSKPDALLLNGDTIDCHRLSRFIKDPKKRNFKLELDTFKALFDIFEKELKCKIYFKIGNHEERYEHFLYEKAGELVGIEEFEFSNIIKARARGIEMIGGKKPMKLNNLWGIHGHEYVGGISAPVNPARGLFLRSKVSCFQGHNHQTSSHMESRLSGESIATYSIGCLSELYPDYMPFNKWNHGFAEIDLDDNGQDYEFRNYRIKNGKVSL